MSSKDIEKRHHLTFEQLKEQTDEGEEFWTARKLSDVKLSRYACYLIVQNGYSSKPVIANGQTYFAIFQNHGYKGLYGGLDAKGIHARKGLKKSQQILDNMGSTERAANLFRATQTEEKLRRGLACKTWSGESI